MIIDSRYIAIWYNTMLNAIWQRESQNFVEAINSYKTPRDNVSTLYYLSLSWPVKPWFRFEIEQLSHMMTSSNWNIFRVTGHLCGEFTGHRSRKTSKLRVTGLCAGAQRPVTRSFDVFFDLRLSKPLSKQWWGWRFETLSRPLWRHGNVYHPWVFLSINIKCCFTGNDKIAPCD